MVGLYGEVNGAKWQGFGVGGRNRGWWFPLCDGPLESHEKVSILKVLYLSTFPAYQEEEYLCIFGLLLGMRLNLFTFKNLFGLKTMIK